jgi:hypothetical protein
MSKNTLYIILRFLLKQEGSQVQEKAEKIISNFAKITLKEAKHTGLVSSILGELS